jgi:hypothetical protein
MKKIIVSILSLMLVSSSALADPFYRRGHEYHSNGNNWVAPLIIGGVVGAIIAETTRPPRVIYQDPAVPPTLICEKTYLRDQYGSYVIDRYGRPVLDQNCYYQ